jgi:hypothetical protein
MTIKGMFQLVKPQEAAEFLGTTVATMAKWRRAKHSDLPYFKFGYRIVRYDMKDLVAFARRQRRKAPRVNP